LPIALKLKHYFLARDTAIHNTNQIGTLQKKLSRIYLLIFF